ncbi:hypothetical protein XI09_01090 [Bradyrhizobium sp. CCBAU 11386]|uniref:apiosidase-like domain-containing protein n=1 Tax=Bradyrhizobium sp. CCBAU 11386 TaxID=1630837 RepID=UPI0023030D26|nr:DUF4038 domain-containing protein [Bradyrhizobium sp. CCBAU 11386]MDA9503457.1 hypothetical protein [Bradyrhizobium sp. CCBAU 11386]
MIDTTTFASGIRVLPWRLRACTERWMRASAHPLLVAATLLAFGSDAVALDASTGPNANTAADRINLLCNDALRCRSDGGTEDGIVPFVVTNDLPTPNPAFFQRAENIIRHAEELGLAVILDPIETTGWLHTLRVNGVAGAYRYGLYLGNRYRDIPNIIWLHGNDFQSWQNKDDDALVQAVARGIRHEAPNQLQTVELNFLTSGSLDDPGWQPLIDMSAAYTYFPTYVQILNEYNRANYKLVFLVEANYELEQQPNTDGGSAQNLRRQEYWTMLSGAAGQLYGSRNWSFEEGWRTDLNTRGAIELRYMKDLFARRRWYDLIPDQTHSVTKAGYHWLAESVAKLTAYLGSYRVSNSVRRRFLSFKASTRFGSITTNSYAATARTSDGSLVITYLPTARAANIDMSKLAATAIAHWFDPTNGRYTSVEGSPFANKGVRQFSPPGVNSAGDSDWVLLLETQPPADHLAPSASMSQTDRSP